MSLRYFIFLATLSVGVASTAQAETRVAVIPIASKGITVKDLSPKKVEESIDGAQIIPYGSVARSAQKLGFKGPALKKPANAAAAGKSAGASHVLLLEGVHKGKSRKAGYSVHVSLIEVNSAKVVFTKTFPMQGKRLNDAVANKVSEDLADKFTGSPAPENDEGDAGGANASADEERPAKGKKVAKADDAEPAEGASEASAETADDDATSTSKEATEGDGSNGGKRESLVINGGIEPYWRGAALSAGGKALPPCFCVANPAQSPLLARIALRGEFYPFSIGGNGAWYEGFGAHLDGGIGIPRTGTDKNPVTAVSYTIGGGLQYRLVLGDTITSPELKFKLGYSAYVFQVKNLVFPSVGFRSPYLGIGGVIPLGTEHVAIVAEVRGGAPTTALVANNSLGTVSSASPSLHVEGGLRFRVAGAMEINALMFLDSYSATFSGSTDLPHTTTNYTNVSVSDRSFGAMIGVGFYL